MSQNETTLVQAVGVVGNPTYDKDHLAGTEVPEGGSTCAKCKFLKDAENRICGEPSFIAWEGPNKPAGSPVIPLPLNRYCSDWFVAAEGTLASGSMSGSETDGALVLPSFGLLEGEPKEETADALGMLSWNMQQRRALVRARLERNILARVPGDSAAARAVRKRLLEDEMERAFAFEPEEPEPETARRYSEPEPGEATPE